MATNSQHRLVSARYLSPSSRRPHHLLVFLNNRQTLLYLTDPVFYPLEDGHHSLACRAFDGQRGPRNYEGYVAVIPPPPPSTGPGTHGQPLGQGTMWFTSGNFYEGMCRYHGKGTLRTATFEYTGDFSKGWITGQGTMNYKDKGEYRGWFLKRKREGQGYMKWAGGITYNGQWKNDKIKGYGTVTWPNGDWWEARWEGSFTDIFAGKGQHGKGRARWHNKSHQGIVYVGDTKDGLRHGFGTLTKPEYKYEGNFTKGKLDGYIKVTNLATKKITYCNYEHGERVDD
ncbi:hypothetical protein CDV55_101482 [Aspergillus turcosus]|nr:hypothetical protein CDV55_101482 [Aspergillus turcosus]